MSTSSNRLLYHIALVFVGLKFSNPDSNLSRYLSYLWILVWGGNAVNILLNLLTNILISNYDVIPENVAYLVGHSGVILGCFLFGLHNKEWNELFDLLESVQQFGKSPQFDKVKVLGDWIAKILLIYITGGLIVYTTAIILGEGKCEQQSKGKRICGVFNPTWWPSMVELTPLRKRLLVVYQMGSSYFLAAIVFITSMVYHASRFIADRADDLCLRFAKVCNVTNEEVQIQEVVNWVNYHEDTIRLCHKFNSIYKKTLSHISLLVAVTLAFLGYQYIKDGGTTYLVYISGYLFLITVICHSGQLIEDNMVEVGRSVYLSNWYECSRKIRKWIQFIIQRGQHEVALDALPMGHANYVLLFTVAKTTYSYLALLQQTM